MIYLRECINDLKTKFKSVEIEPIVTFRKEIK